MGSKMVLWVRVLFIPLELKWYTGREGRGLQDEIHCAESTYPHTPSVAFALF